MGRMRDAAATPSYWRTEIPLIIDDAISAADA
jgi:hypothetical protein